MGLQGKRSLVKRSIKQDSVGLIGFLCLEYPNGPLDIDALLPEGMLLGRENKQGSGSTVNLGFSIRVLQALHVEAPIRVAVACAPHRP